MEEGQKVKQRPKHKQEDLIMEAKNFFDAHKKEIGESIRKEEGVVYLLFPQLAIYSPRLSESVIDNPEETLVILELALEESGLVANPRVRLLDLPKSCFTSISSIRAKHLDKLLFIEGIVRQASEVRPQVVNAKFECPNCGAVLSVLQIERKFREPSRCSCGWKGNFKLLSKEMVDAQRLVIEESPDTLDGGEQPRRIHVFLQEDLVDPRMEKRSTPGSKVRIFGILKEVPVPLQTGAISTRFDHAIEANNVIPMEESFDEIEMSEEDERQIKELAADVNVFKTLTKSVAPSIYGFERIKEAVLLQMFGGVRKTKSDGGKTRGDIHVLLVGDPGVAKSVLLKYISTVAAKGRYVSGKAATGAGLCVAPHSVVLTNPGGMTAIKNVVEERLSSKAEYRPGIWKQDNIGDIKIQSLSHNLKLHSKCPKSIWKLKVPSKVFEIALSSGKKIELTGNTQLYVLRDGETSWIKSKEIRNGMYIATPRVLIGGESKSCYSVDLINSNPFVHGVKPFVKMVVELLSEKYGSIRMAARKLGINENKLYHHWVNENARGNIKLNDFREISEDVGLAWKDEVKLISLYNGKKYKLPVLLDKDILYLGGLVAGDGDMRKIKSGSCSVRLSNSNFNLHKIFRDILDEKFDLHYGVIRGNDRRPEATRAHSKLLGEILLSLGIPLSPKSNKVFLSDELLHLSNDLLAEYIAGLYDCDGSVYVRGGKGSDCIDLTSCSERLIRQLQLVFLRFGIHARLRSREPSKGVIKGKYMKWILEIRGSEQIRKFAESIPLKHPEKKRKLKKLLLKKVGVNSNVDVLPGVGKNLKKILLENKISLRKVGWHENLSRKGMQKILDKIKVGDTRIEKMKELAYSDIFWENVVSVKEKIPDYSYVYDLTVEDSHNFIVDGVMVHNTAAVVKDEFLKGWSLEAGAMVLSNKGTVCIDEIEKMDEHDRSTMHEALEQQSVTISKANIQATLKAETTVLAAGNPKLGRFDPYTPIPQQIDISPALLSRFDVTFVIRDLPNKAQDEAVATHILEEHKQEVVRDVIDTALLRKYIAYTKQKFIPILTDEAIEEIKNFYITLRSQPSQADSEIKSIAITARQLEGIIRLSEAHAKLRMSKEVKSIDAKKAIELLRYSLMQVGYDEETKTFDIDRMTTGVTASKRGKIVMVKETLSQLESRLGKLIPLGELEKAVYGKMSDVELEEAITQLSKSGDIFKPKKGYLQRI